MVDCVFSPQWVGASVNKLRVFSRCESSMSASSVGASLQCLQWVRVFSGCESSVSASSVGASSVGASLQWVPVFRGCVFSRCEFQ
jgi:hypothetical protein